MVGDDGQSELGGLPLKGELFIQWGEGKNARGIATYALAEDSLKQAITIASATCIRPSS
ncbi:outer membrane usher protein FimD precursor [Salmonella enterica]|nr:outer membrane usher protein FimD precursor [Salmonella enterica]